MMSKKLTRTLCAALAASALAAVPALSAAQGGEGQGKQEGQSQKSQGSQQQGRQGEQQQEKITKRLTVHKSVSLPLTNGCSYSATIDGTVSPTKQKQQQQQQKEKGQAQAQTQPLDADLRVTASAMCPNQATITVSENVTRTGPLSHEALEEALERRGTIFTSSQGRHCAFVPDFELSSEGVQGVGVAYMCAIQPGQGQQQQGG